MDAPLKLGGMPLADYREALRRAGPEVAPVESRHPVPELPTPTPDETTPPPDPALADRAAAD